MAWFFFFFSFFFLVQCTGMFSGDAWQVEGGNGQFQLLLSHAAVMPLNLQLIKQCDRDTGPGQPGRAVSCCHQKGASVEMSL